ncbi:MAG: beta-lactamase family protein [Clostridia bacterium]|nr:beta-lactamase family protein [Clostridia bacterium]
MSISLQEGIRFFTRETRILSGLSVACGADTRVERAADGDVSERSVFDLASVTKLFTGLCAMKLKEEGLLDFSRPVFDYDPRFSRLKDRTVEELMTFAVTVRTPVRLDGCGNRESALAALFGAETMARRDERAYSDIPAMILKYVIEAAGGMPLMDCVRKTVLEPAGMTETWAKVPKERIGDCQSYDREHRIEAGRYILREGLKPGIPHDPKAAAVQGDSGDLCGHAGLFSTREDMIRFCRAVLERKIVSDASLREMAVNRTGQRRQDGSYTQYLGLQCYVRHPVQYYSEIPVYMGKAAFGIGGFTGNHVSVDPERNLFTVFLGNRVLNRLTVLIPEAGKDLTDYGLNADGSGMFRWTDGEVIPSSVKYVHQKDTHLHRAVADTLGLAEIPF